MRTLATICLLLGAAFTPRSRCQAEEPAASDPISDGKPLSAWVKALSAPDYPIRTRAAQAIGRLGAQAKSAVPALREAMGKRGGPIPAEAGAALWKVDREEFTKILTAERPTRARYVAILSLTHIGADAKGLAPVILTMATDLSDRGPDRQHALLALGFIGANPADVLPVLTAALQDEGGRFGQYARMEAAQALGHLGPKAKGALPVLHRALADPDPQVRVDAANAVWKIERDHRRALPVLVKEALNGGENGSAAAARQRAVRGLGDIGPAAKEAFPDLLKRWQAERSAYQKEEIAKALKSINAKAAGEAGVKVFD
jgi:HEAT repeat protein